AIADAAKASAPAATAAEIAATESAAESAAGVEAGAACRDARTGATHAATAESRTATGADLGAACAHGRACARTQGATARRGAHGAGTIYRRIHAGVKAEAARTRSAEEAAAGLNPTDIDGRARCTAAASSCAYAKSDALIDAGRIDTGTATEAEAPASEA